MAEGTQQHPLKIYFYVWTLLFVFSAFSYWVDWYGFQGFTRWGLILFFMPSIPAISIDAKVK